MAKTSLRDFVPIPDVQTRHVPRSQRQLNKARKKAAKKNPNAVQRGVSQAVNRGDTITDLIRQGRGK